MTGARRYALPLAALLAGAGVARGDDPPPRAVGGVAFSPDGKLLAAGCGAPTEPGAVTVWAVADRRVRFHHVEKSGIPGVAFAPDGRTLAIAVFGQAARLLDADTGRVRASFPHPREVRGVAFSPDGKLLASGSRDGTVRLWDVAAQREVARLIPGGSSTQGQALQRSPRSEVPPNGVAAF